jgi:Peptidase A4 family
VEQDGTLDYCSGPGATPAYYTWWEFYPYNSVQLYASSSAGAVIYATILYNPSEIIDGVPGVYTLNLFDYDNGASFSIIGGGWDLGYTPSDASAECISEAPGLSTGLAPLTNYGTTTFYACADTIGSHFAGIGSQSSSVALYKIDQNRGGTNVQVTGGLVSFLYGRSEFSITWKHFT